MQLTASVTPLPVLQSYLRMELILVELEQAWQPEQADQLQQVSRTSLTSLCEQVRTLEQVPEPEQARALGLQALGRGLLCGALDGLILYRSSRQPAPLEISPGPLERPLTLLRAGLEQAARVADGDWREQHPDNLQLLSAYGKQHNQATAEEAEAAAQGALEDYQTFLLATFKAGYAIGLVDSAVVCVAKEHPGEAGSR